MSVQNIAKLSKLLGQFLTRFACCFARPAGRTLLQIYTRGLLSDVQRKNAEAIALDQNVAPRTLQRFLESIVWDEQMLRDRCQQIVATEHAHPDAIGCIDETGTAKSGQETAGVKRQYNGSRAKFRTSPRTRPPFENRRLKSIVSRIHTAAVKSGKSAGRSVGETPTRTNWSAISAR